MTVSVSSATSTPKQGDVVQLTAVARDQFGDVVPGTTATWSSSALAVATVSATGLLQALAGGSVTVTATTHLVMSPLDFMQRLAALVPRPRLHLIRFHGVLATSAKLRALVVPQGRTWTSCRSCRTARPTLTPLGSSCLESRSASSRVTWKATWLSSRARPSRRRRSRRVASRGSLRR